MNQCDGQISLMDMMNFFTQPDEKEPPVLLSEGQHVYKVVRGDIEEHIVTGETWTCGEGNRGYRLQRVGGCYDCTWNTQIDDSVVFTDRMRAEHDAEKYLSENEHIIGENIKAKKVVAYRYIYNEREIINFYAALENGDVYFHYGSMYEHIGKSKEIDKFEEDRNKHIESDGYMDLDCYKPEFANMYKCKHDSWIYAEARYNSLVV